jgi:hypothetical protein
VNFAPVFREHGGGRIRRDFGSAASVTLDDYDDLSISGFQRRWHVLPPRARCPRARQDRLTPIPEEEEVVDTSQDTSNERIFEKCVLASYAASFPRTRLFVEGIKGEEGEIDIVEGEKGIKL